jgi:hypothetical protein
MEMVSIPAGNTGKKGIFGITGQKIFWTARVSRKGPVVACRQLETVKLG